MFHSSTRSTRRRLVQLCSTLAIVVGLVSTFDAPTNAKPKDPKDKAELKQHLAEIDAAFQTDDDGVVPIIVSLSDDPAVLPNGKDQHFNAKRQEVLATLGEASLRGLKALDGAPFVSMHVTQDQLKVLVKLPQVADVTIDGVSSVEGTTYFGGADGQQLTDQWDYTQINASWTNANGWTGRGMKIAIIDSQFDRNNPYLAGRIVNEACFATNTDGTGACPNGGTYQYAQTAAGVPGSALWSTCTFHAGSCGHGTHVAHTAAGAYGVARGASIVAIRAGHSEWDAQAGSYVVKFSNSDLLNALWYVHAILPKSGIVVAAVNMRRYR